MGVGERAPEVDLVALLPASKVLGRQHLEQVVAHLVAAHQQRLRA